MKYLGMLLLLTAFAASAGAQITITKSDYINAEEAQENASVDTALNPLVLLPIIDESGPNQTWDFTPASFNFDARTSYAFIPYSDTILGATDSGFLPATYVQEDPATFADGFDSPPSNEFYKVTDAGAWDLGGCSDSDGAPGSLLHLNPPEEILPFPLTYQTAWQSTSNPNGPDFSLYNSSITQIEVVDGYGILILPNHSDSALRVKETIITNVQGLQTADTLIFYKFYTHDGYYATITADSYDTAASYTVPSNSAVNPQPLAASGLSLTLLQNPAIAGNRILLYSMPNSGTVQIELMDELGRTVQMLGNGFESAGEHSLPIEPAPLVAGTYFVRVETSGASAVQEIVLR